MNLFVIRHGQTNANLNHIIAGVTDIPLNENGILQAKEASNKIKDIKFDKVFCSPLKRAKMTCELVNPKCSIIEYVPNIIERNAGEYEGKDMSTLDLNEYWNYHLKKHYDGAEDIDKLFERVYAFIESLKRKYNNENILVVTHDGICRCIACYFNGIPEDGNIRVYSHKNCEIRKYEL